MIKIVETKKDLKDFIYFVKTLYSKEEHFIYPVFRFLFKELVEEVLNKKEYKAILCIRENQILGRVMFTYDESKKQQKKICYFSNFDAYDDVSIAKELFDYIENDMKLNNIDYLEGTFSPYDPDTRRGILMDGYDRDPVLFTSYNYPYYPKLLENIGFSKAIDTVLLQGGDINDKSKRKLNAVSKYFLRNHDIRVDSINFKNLERDLLDVHKIIDVATNDIIYQDAPTMEMVENAARELRPFINPDFIKIARENDTNEPVGFCLVLPDFNQVLKMTKGKVRIIKMLLGKRKITRALGKMQYVVPKYQNSGLIALMFDRIYDEFIKYGITEFEAGTMMEDNQKAITTFYKFGGKIIKTLRIYGKEITK